MLEERLRDHPIQPDLNPDNVNLQAWWHLTATYPVVEMALKVLTETVGKPTHNISCLYREFAKRNPEQAEKIETAVGDYVNFYQVDTEEFPEFQSATAFLEKIGGGREYINLRYWPIEDADLHLTWPELFVEIASALGSILLDKDPYTVSQRIHRHINKAIFQPQRWSDILEQPETDGGPLINELKDWMSQHGGWETAFQTFLNEGLDPRWSRALQSVLDGALQKLTHVDDREIQHFISKPKSKEARSSPKEHP